MGGMDEMMEAMMGSMSKEDKQEMMAKMMEGINMAEMMPRMMMGMMGHGGGVAPRSARAPHKMSGCHGEHPPVMERMMTQMMPGCVDMMLPSIPKGERSEFVLQMIGTLIEKGSVGMSEEEKSNLVARALERITSL